jgi:hypothetical protein
VPAEFGDSDDVRVGEDVVLVGTPEGFSLTVTGGVISAVRDVAAGYRMFQTDSAASEGSSGGGMFNAYGALIGVVTSQIPDAQNLNFAVPINYVRGLFSTEPTMSLVELAIKTGDYRPDSSGRLETEEQPSDLDQARVERLSEIVRGSQLPFEHNEQDELHDSLWSYTLPVDDESRDLFLNLEEIEITVELLTDEVVLVTGWTADPEGELSKQQMEMMLRLNYDSYVAKVSVSENGSVWAHAEVYLDGLSSNLLDVTSLLVATATDELAGIVSGDSTEIASETDDIEDLTGGDEVASFLQGHLRLVYDSSKWTEIDIDFARRISGNPALEKMFGYVSPDNSETEAFASVAVVPAGLVFSRDVRLETVADVGFEAFQERDPNAREVRRESFRLDGKELLYHDVLVTIDTEDLAYRTFYYSDSHGTAEFICWTHANLLDEYSEIFFQWISGLEIDGR